MSKWVNPPLVSEREPGIDEDCVPCSALMLVLAHHPRLAPATRYEAQKLRAASGYGTEGGTSVEGIEVGVAKRYGLHPRTAHTFSELWSMLTPGHGAYVIIKPDRFPVSHPLRRWVPFFHSLHCIYVGRKGPWGRVWMIDPEGVAPYKGDWISKAELQKAFVGSAGVLALHTR